MKLPGNLISLGDLYESIEDDLVIVNELQELLSGDNKEAIVTLQIVVSGLELALEGIGKFADIEEDEENG